MNKSLNLSITVFTTVMLTGNTINQETNIIYMTENLLKIPTSGRLTNWLFTKHGGIKFGTTERNSI